MDPYYLATLGVQALISACTCFAVIKLGLTRSDRDRLLLLLLLAASIGMLGLHFDFANSFPISGSPYLQLPGALYVFLPVFAVLCCLFNIHKERPNTLSAFLTALVTLGIAHYLSFPWAVRGTDGWIAFAVITLAGAAYVGCMQSLGDDKPRAAIAWWAAHSIVIIPVLLGLIAIGHIEIMYLAITPIAIMGFVSWFLKQPVFGLRLSFFIGTSIALFLGNAAMRYVPSSDDPGFITWIIRLAPLALLASALSIALTIRKKTSAALIGGCFAAIILIATAGLCVYAYNYENPETESSSSGWDYDSL